MFGQPSSELWISLSELSPGPQFCLKNITDDCQVPCWLINVFPVSTTLPSSTRLVMPPLKKVASSVWRLLRTLLAIPSNQLPFYYFWERVSLCYSHRSRTLCRLRWPQTHRNPPASSSCMKGLKSWATTPSHLCLSLTYTPFYNVFLRKLVVGKSCEPNIHSLVYWQLALDTGESYDHSYDQSGIRILFH